MTDCNRQPMLFASLNRRKILADFNGGQITSDAGALLLREADQRIGLIDAIDACIKDPRDPDAIILKVTDSAKFAAGEVNRLIG